MTKLRTKIQKAYIQCLKEKNTTEYLAGKKERIHVESLKNNELNAKQRTECIFGNIDDVKTIGSPNVLNRDQNDVYNSSCYGSPLENQNRLQVQMNFYKKANVPIKEIIETKKELKGLKTIYDIFNGTYKSTIHSVQRQKKKNGGQRKSDTPKDRKLTSRWRI